MRKKIFIDDNWSFKRDIPKGTLPKDAREGGFEKVALPHSVAVTPLHYFDESVYQTISFYERELIYDSLWDNHRIYITFEGAAHKADLYINDEFVLSHGCGYTAFRTEITKYLKEGVNTVSVILDSNESLNIPPFGNVIDYMTYGGIYRDVYIEVLPQNNIEDVFIKPIRKSSDKYMLALDTEADIEESENADDFYVEYEIFSPEGDTVSVSEKTGWGKKNPLILCSGVREWDIENPVLYTLKSVLYMGDEIIDECKTEFGFRTISFEADGFYLNTKKIKLFGLNRHQSYPYIGYAAPKSMQIKDAHILKYELGLNAVRTSHYPQSKDFIRECDKIGLLVFTEIPGWQHIGDAAWRHQAYENTREMVLQYRNHPSIILWGVRINESKDCDVLYEKTNLIARRLDPTRPTGGVRYLKKSSFLEDVYTYNDFNYDGKRRPVSKKRDVTSDMGRAYLISEYNGHMYPTKAFDDENQRTEHALRHAAVIDAAAGEKNIAGSFGWCMCDYNTHRDFGSGDRICYHGVMDMFRNPKLAAAVYTSQGEEEDVLFVSSAMDIGEKPECIRGEIYAFTNADLVRFYKNDELICEFVPDYERFPNLLHPPVKIDDFTGDKMMKEEGFTEEQNEAVKALLNASTIYGMNNIPKLTYANAAKLIVKYSMKPDDAVELYNKYIGDWGGKSSGYRFEAVKDGRVVKTVVKAPAEGLKLCAEKDEITLNEERTYDMELIRLSLKDENNNVMPFANEAVLAEITGDAEIVGPKMFTLFGGMGGILVKSKGKSGKASLILCGENFEKIKINITINKQEVDNEG
ncbi:MAG: glycoside hydrolase family 2 protein [Eubacterium sp.]|nr:glycoside hydrolase family 2 protein [Eubacterium sp.]